MARLAIAAGEEAVFSGEHVVLPVDRRTADAAGKAGGRAILVYKLAHAEPLTFVGGGMISGLDFQPGGAASVRLSQYVEFAQSVSGDEEAKEPRARSMLMLGDERFASILEKGEGRAGVADAAVRSIIPPETHVAVRDAVLRNWDYRCAITGARFRPEFKGRAPEVVVVRSLTEGGRLHVGNYLPMVPLAAAAWRRGYISVGPNLDIVARQNRLDADLLGMMVPSGRLIVPDDPALGPDPENLAFHFRHVFGR